VRYGLGNGSLKGKGAEVRVMMKTKRKVTVMEGYISRVYRNNNGMTGPHQRNQHIGGENEYV